MKGSTNDLAYFPQRQRERKKRFYNIDTLTAMNISCDSVVSFAEKENKKI
jgi:hypothetical protein